jgi:hypothetical protein
MDNMADKLVENIESSCEKLGQISLTDVSLESADPILLDPREHDINEHVAIQPSAIAYYGMMYKEVERGLGVVKRQYERWRNARHREIVETSTRKPSSIKEIDSRIDVDFADEVTKWEEQIAEYQRKADAIGIYYDAWKQKSYMLKMHADMNTDELNTQSYIRSEQPTVNRQPQKRAKKSSTSYEDSLDSMKGFMDKKKTD